MGSFDITFCCKSDCINFDCKRHITRTYGYQYPVSMGEFKECKYWCDRATTSPSTISDLLGDK